MLFSILLQQLSGVINIAIFFISFYYFSSRFALSITGIFLYSLLVGMYVGYVSDASARNVSNGLTFAPTELYSKQFTDEIVNCGCDPESVCVRYAHTDDAVAMTFFNTIAIDSMAWSSVQDDPEALKARELIEKTVIPNVPENKKELYRAIQSNLSQNAQKFIFRHELGHVFYNDSSNRILRTGIVGATATGITLAIAYHLMPVLGGLGTIVVSVGVGVVVDLLLSYATNFFFKSYEEKRADIFATRFSSKEEIEAVADFFETYEDSAQKYRETFNSVLFRLPITVYNGHIDGITRAHYLREFAQLK
jgi:hypothetical protein